MSLPKLARLALIAALVPVLAPAGALAAPKAKPKPLVIGEPTIIAPKESDWRTPDPQNLLVIDTNKGRVIVEMYPEVAPKHVAQIRTLAGQHFYDGLAFFRVVEGFMDQTGDPQNTGEGGSKLPNLAAEFSFRRTSATPFVKASERGGEQVGYVGALPVTTQADDLMAMTASGTVAGWGLFCKGVAGMARANDPNSANSQFYLMRDTYSSLNRKYTVWGKVLVGQVVVDAIKVGEPVPDPQDKMLSIRLASDLPEADRPKLQVLDAHSAAFRQQIDIAVDKLGSTFSVCDLSPAVRGPAVKP